MAETNEKIDLVELSQQIKGWSRQLGFQQIGFTDTNLTNHEEHLLSWLEKGYHGEMNYMEKHGSLRTRPEELITGTLRVISLRMDYFPENCMNADEVLNNPNLAYISRYALGRDYHKLIRKRIQKLIDNIKDTIGPFNSRAFVDSAPVMEKPLAEKAGLGWIGKHTNLINRKTGSWFFLGEIYTDLQLPVNKTKSEEHCGTCHECMDVCPTDAIIAPFQLDARKCISYLTIELQGTIPVEFRKAIGNRIYGCDDCQLVCPWNRFSQHTHELEFNVRSHLDSSTLLELFAWDEKMFLEKTAGSAIRRIGYDRWIRNIAIALGNTTYDEKVVESLQKKLPLMNEIIAEHLSWAIAEQSQKMTGQ